MIVEMRYGRQGLEVELPDEANVQVLRFNKLPQLAAPQRAVQESLASPLGTAPLAEIARGRQDACVVISDITRPVPNELLVRPVLEVLEAVGLRREDILILVATGLPREATKAELVEMLGPQIASSYRIESHVARDLDSQAELGKTPAGTRVLIDRRYVEADLKLLVSLVEPHLFAGYSGGRKAICPGLAASETIFGFHSPALIESAAAITGNIGSNPSDIEAWAVARQAGGADFTVNCTLDEQRQITGIFSGHLRDAPLAAMEVAERQAKVVLDEPVDITITSNAGYPLDLTFYQAIKAATAGGQITRPGGTIIICQENAEGIGNDEYTELMLRVADPHEYVQRVLATGENHIDQWALHQLEKVLRERRIYNYSTGVPPEQQRQLFVEPVNSVEEGLGRALAEYGPDAKIAVIPEGPYVLPCLADCRVGRMTVREMTEECRELYEW